MRRTIVRRTAVAACAASLALLVSACGSDASADKPADKPAAKADAKADAEPAAKALSQAELDKLILTQADVENHRVAKPNMADLEAVKIVSTDKPACEPLVDAMSLQGVGKPAVTSSRKIVAIASKPPKDATPEEKMEAGLKALGGTITADTLGSYDGKGAEEAFAELRSAAEACADGFTLIVGKDKTKITKVAPASSTGGDEAVAYTVSVDLEGTTGVSHLVAVRKGGTLASFYAQSLTGTAKQPKDVIDAQLAKLG